MANYTYLDTSDGNNSTEVNEVYSIDLSASWDTEGYGVNGRSIVMFQFITSSVGGSGTLTAQYTINDTDWYTLVDTDGNDVTWTISSDTDWVFITDLTAYSSIRFTHDGSNSAGTIKVGAIYG